MLIVVLTATAFAADLQSQLEALVRAHHGQAAIYARHLKTGASVAVNADTPVPTASVIKLAIMVTAFDLAHAGKLSLEEKLALTKENQVSGSGILGALTPGLQITLGDAIVLMIQLSDNTATNMVIDRLSVAAVDQKLTAMGEKNTWLYKKVMKPAEGPMPSDQPKFGLGKTTAREMADVMASIERCDIGDAALCKRMIEILKGQQNRDAIPRYIEFADTSERPSMIANKTGSLDAVRNDVALVYTAGGPIVISAFTWDNQDRSWTPDNQGALLIGRMAQAILQAWAPAAVKPSAAGSASNAVPVTAAAPGTPKN